jgi:hypothetical protein
LVFDAELQLIEGASYVDKIIHGAKPAGLRTTTARRQHRSGLIFPVGGNVRNYALGKCKFLDFARHVSQINHKAIYVCHPRKWVLFGQAGKRPPWIKRAYTERIFDRPRPCCGPCFR